MYKRYNREQLQKFWGNFFANLKRIYKQENVGSIKDLLKAQFAFGNQSYFRDGTDPLFSFKKYVDRDQSVSYVFIDEREKIELQVNEEVIKLLNGKLKNNKVVPKWDSVLDVLFQEYQNWEFRTIGGKPYVVYDIETLYAAMNLKWLAFELGYTINSSDQGQSFERLFKYVEKEAIKKYVDFLLDFDGYIVWFNNIGFDNIVIWYNAGYSEDIIQKLHDKSVDLFYYLRNLTNKRMWLNKVATALVGLQKTLSGGWSEWADLLKDRLATGSLESLKKVKDYCKWDVKMTLWVLLYLYKFWEFFIEWEQYLFDEKEFILLSKDMKKQQTSTQPQKEIYSWLF